MLSASDADYKTAVATNLLNHSAAIKVLEAKGFSPAGCTDGTDHWVFVVGDDQKCYYKSYSGGWTTWHDLGGQFSSGLAAYCYNSGASGEKTKIWVYGQGINNQLWQIVWSGSAWGAWVDLGGNID